MMQVSVEEVITRADIYDYINQIVTLKHTSNGVYKGLCPFHNEKTPSFSLNRNKQFYYCFGCKEHGNVINFLRKTRNLTFIEALNTLKEDLNIPITNNNSDHELYSKAYKTLEAIQDKFQKKLWENKKVIDYLNNRGISENTIKRFGIGFANSNIHVPEIDRDINKTLGLYSKTGACYFRNRLMIPIKNPVGKIIGFGGRVLDESLPKYLNSKESFIFHKSKILFGLDHAKSSKKDYMIVVEGYMDVIGLSEHGIQNCVASLGTAITKNHINLIFKYVDKVAFCFDGDNAGQNAAWKTLVQLLPIIGDGKEIKFVMLPSGEDPDSLIKNKGITAWREIFKSSLDFSDFFFKYLAKENPTKTISQKAAYADKVKQYLEQMQNSVLKQLMLNKIEDIFNARIISETPKQNKQSTQQSNDLLTRIIVNLIYNPDLANKFVLGEYIKRETDQKSLFLCELHEYLQEKDYANIAVMLNCLEKENIKSELNKYITYPYEETLKSDTIKNLKYLTLKLELQLLGDYINNNYEKLSADKDELKLLLREKSNMIYLLNQIRESHNE